MSVKLQKNELIHKTQIGSLDFSCNLWEINKTRMEMVKMSETKTPPG